MRPVTLEHFLDRIAGVRVLVVGDVMLDAYVAGSASRISPEAPVPVVGVRQRRYVPGGAANVAANIAMLGGRTCLAGVTGVDDSSHRLRAALATAGIDAAGVVEDPVRPTTTKTRITASGQQIVRFDEEDRSPLSEAIEVRLREACVRQLSQAQACVISDYAKGVIGDAFCRWLIEQAQAQNKPVVVDPKSRNLGRYAGATVITPNLKETAAASAIPLEDAADLERAVDALLPRIAPSALLVTRGEDGMSLFAQDRRHHHLPALRNEVADVTGAGDTVVAAVAASLAMGLGLLEAACIANIAAAIAVSHHGTWAVSRDELAQSSAQFDIASMLAVASV